VRSDELAVRLIAPAYTIGVSDGQLNGTPSMRFSLIGRELVNENIDLHLNANTMAGLIAVVACDKPPVGTLAAILEHNAPAVLLSDGSIRPGTDPQTGERIDIITGFQFAGDPDSDPHAHRVACLPGPGQLRGHVHLQHDADLHRRARHGAAADGRAAVRRPSSPAGVPDQLIDCLVAMTDAGITPRDIVTPASLRNALTVAIAMGGSTNVLLHSVEIARAAGFDSVGDVLSQSEFNALSRRLPVLVNMRPFGFYSMVDVDAKGGLQVIVKELLDAGLLDGETH
jgi:dihydroxy-acid dehydratase